MCRSPCIVNDTPADGLMTASGKVRENVSFCACVRNQVPSGSDARDHASAGALLVVIPKRQSPLRRKKRERSEGLNRKMRIQISRRFVKRRCLATRSFHVVVLPVKSVDCGAPRRGA